MVIHDLLNEGKSFFLDSKGILLTFTVCVMMLFFDALLWLVMIILYMWAYKTQKEQQVRRVALHELLSLWRKKHMREMITALSNESNLTTNELKELLQCLDDILTPCSCFLNAIEREGVEQQLLYNDPRAFAQDIENRLNEFNDVELIRVLKNMKWIFVDMLPNGDE